MYKLKIYLNKNSYLTRESGCRWGAGVEVKASEIPHSRSPAGRVKRPVQTEVSAARSKGFVSGETIREGRLDRGLPEFLQAS